MKDSTRLPAKYAQGQKMPSNISRRRALGYWSDICWRANFVVGPIENRARTLHEESAAANVGRTRQDRVCRSKPLLDSLHATTPLSGEETFRDLQNNAPCCHSSEGLLCFPSLDVAVVVVRCRFGGDGRTTVAHWVALVWGMTSLRRSAIDKTRAKLARF